MATKPFDQGKADAFAGRMLDILNGAALALMTSIGHQVDLFGTMAGLRPSTSQQIADAAGLNERYVREWLGAMVTGRIVEYDPSNRTYTLPSEHAASVTRAAGPDNLAAYAQMIPQFSLNEEAILHCFRHGGGVPYSSFAKFQQLQAELSGQVHDAVLIEGILPLVPGLIQRLEAGIDVADIGCGQGHAINLMAQAFPKSRFTGYDFSEEGTARATQESKEMGLANAHFQVKDVAQLDVSGGYDFITAFDTIHDQAHPASVLQGISTALRRDGTFLMVDIAGSSELHENLDHPIAPLLYSVSFLHCMTVSLALDGDGLGTMWGEQLARQMLADAGFTQVTVARIEGDIENAYYVASKG